MGDQLMFRGSSIISPSLLHTQVEMLIMENLPMLFYSEEEDEEYYRSFTGLELVTCDIG